MITVQSMIPAASLLASEPDWVALTKLGLCYAISVCILGGLLQLIFGKGSSAVKAVFSCIHIALMYLCAMVLFSLAPGIRSILSPLPFVTVHSDSIALWDITALRSAEFFPAMLQLFLLAFLVNLLEDLVPRGNQILSWYFFRLLTACSALACYCVISILINRYAPQVFGQWAAPILVASWLLIGILGLSKGLLTLIAAAFGPVLGVLFAFFFTNLVGKQFTKSILTCLLTMAVLFELSRSGFSGFVFSQLSSAAFAPTFVVSLACLYLFGKFL